MKCTFCKKELPEIGNITYVKKNGDVYHFCSSKCEKSLLMGRDYRKKKWVTSPHKRGSEKKQKK
ncbi:MAG: 50S ribosomal protein L24e [Candidatus Altiarchaeota archaeon]|nr:50S ribosomal protein L24e [Candidatus Altiarchaeota archaeon]